MRPNFMIIGAMKSGTTSLWKYLDAHPDVFMCYPKEPGFFVEELTWGKGWEWYESLFADAGGARAIGEASTHYTKWPEYQGVAERIAEHLPDLKLIYVVRDPVGRAISHYWHNVHYNHETRDPLSAVKEDCRYVDFGRYAHQLSFYLQKFPRQDILVVHFDELTSAPAPTLKKVFTFLGVEPQFNVPDAYHAHNAGRAEVRRTRRLLHAVRWSPWWTRMAPYVPRVLKEAAKRREFSSLRRADVDESGARRYLTELYAGEMDRLNDLISLTHYPQPELDGEANLAR